MDEQQYNMMQETQQRLVEQIKLDGIVLEWRTNWTANNYCYKRGVALPPPLYDDDLKQWTENSNQECDIRKVDKDKLDKFYNADLLLKAIIYKEESDKLFEKLRKKYEEWRKTDEYKQLMKDCDDGQ